MCFGPLHFSGLSLSTGGDALSRLMAAPTVSAFGERLVANGVERQVVCHCFEVEGNGLC